MKDDQLDARPVRDEVLDKANIDNLTAVWCAMGAQPLPEAGMAGLQASPGWPNRHWFDWGQAVEEGAQLRETLSRLPGRAVVPVWAAGDEPGPLEQTLRALGFAVSLEQRAMHLRLADWQSIPSGVLQLRRVQYEPDVLAWAELCGSAFGYPMDAQIITRLSRDDSASLWLAERDGEAVATAMLFQTGEVVGMHQVGVPHSFRGQGIARELMQALLDLCGELGASYVTLQASSMGEGLYRQLGFTRRFMVRSYRRG
jgi:GNAT superfamily N-acetyltransferase